MFIRNLCNAGQTALWAARHEGAAGVPEPRSCARQAEQVLLLVAASSAEAGALRHRLNVTIMHSQPNSGHDANPVSKSALPVRYSSD